MRWPFSKVLHWNHFFTVIMATYGGRYKSKFQFRVGQLFWILKMSLWSFMEVVLLKISSPNDYDFLRRCSLLEVLYTLFDKKNDALRKIYPNVMKIGRSDVYVQKNKWLQFEKNRMIYWRDRASQIEKVGNEFFLLWHLCKQLFGLASIDRVCGCSLEGYQTKFSPTGAWDLQYRKLIGGHCP